MNPLGSPPVPSLASIPSPADGVVRIGPVPLHMYGLLIAIGVLVAVRIAVGRWVRSGHEARDLEEMVPWVVLAGVVGARVYHVLSDIQLFRGDWVRALRIWEGGLSIWGAVGGGALAVVVLARRRGLSVLELGDAIAPGLLAAQAIGRWGNWFNQELFGRPTDLPWGLEIDLVHRPPGYEAYETFHPTFLYESLWVLAVLAAILWTERRVRLDPGRVFALYIVGYTFGRFFFEWLRIDPANTIGPLRLNGWVSVGLFAFGLAWFVWLGRRGTTGGLPAGPDADAVTSRTASSGEETDR